MNIMRFMELSDSVCEGNDYLVSGEKKQEEEKMVEQKIYKAMKRAGAANITIGVLSIVLGIVGGILLIVTGGKLLADKSKIIF